MNDSYTYDAFISYRHAKLDTFVAESLHKSLEAFHLPGKLSRQKAAGEKTKITRIFRDKDELPLASDLSNPIRNALEHSEFLIVICSPRTPESVWVQREIETFISLHDREHVLAVLIEGEPEDSFPNALREYEQECILPDGTVTKVTHQVEPLAADLRGNSHHEIRKKLRQEILRLAAPMFQCSYDDLKQRHRERKIRRIIGCLIAVCAFFLCFGSYSTYQALRIQKQSEEIEQQSLEIQRQYTDILKNSLYNQSQDALTLLESGDRMESVHTAVNALPKGSSDTQTPFVPNAQFALSEALYVYQPSTYFLPSSMLKHNIPISDMKVSPSGEHLLTIDAINKVHIWDMTCEQEIASFSWNGSLSLVNEDRITFLNDSEICYIDDSNIVCYNFVTCQNTWSLENIYSYGFHLKFSPSLTKAAITGNSRVDVIDLKDGSYLYQSQWPLSVESTENDFSTNSLGLQMAFNEEENTLAFTTNTYSASHGEVRIVDLNTSKTLQEISFTNPDVSCMAFCGEQLLIAADTYTSMEEMAQDYLANYIETQLYCYQYATGILQWCTDFSGNLLEKLIYHNVSETLIAQSSNAIYTIALTNGLLLSSQEFESPIVNSYFVPESFTVVCFTLSGNIYVWNLDSDYFSQYNSPIPFSKVRTAFRGKNFLAVLPYNECNIMVSRAPENPDAKKLIDKQSSYSNMVLDAESRHIAYYKSGEHPIYVFNYPSGTSSYTISPEDFVQDVFFMEQNENCIVVLGLTGIYFYDASNGEKQYECLFPNFTYIHNFILDKNNQMLYLFDSRSYLTFDLNQKCLSSAHPLDPSVFPEDAPAVAAGNGKIIVANTSSDTVDIWNADFSQKLLAIPVSTYYIKNLFLDGNAGEHLFIVYKNYRTEVYNLSTGTLEKDYGQLAFAPDSCIPISGEKGSYILSNDYSQYLCTETHDILAYLPQAYCVDTNNNIAITYDYTSIYMVPLYTLDDLLEKAAQLEN